MGTDVDMGSSNTQVDESYNEAAGPSSPTRAGGIGGQLAGTPSRSTPAPGHSEPARQPRPKMRITHDRYIQIQQAVVMHLHQHEQRHAQGIDRDELIDWYLETMEQNMSDVDQLENEKELFTKVLRKLVKVCCGCFVLAYALS
jgi:DNA replication licensing factor MCM6